SWSKGIDGTLSGVRRLGIPRAVGASYHWGSGRSNPLPCRRADPAARLLEVPLQPAAARRLRRHLVRRVLAVGESEGDRERELAPRRPPRERPLAPELSPGQQVEAYHLAVLHFDEAEKVGLITPVARLCLQVDRPGQPAVLEGHLQLLDFLPAPHGRLA